ncbi:MAG: metallopeptidase family protein [Actinomycetes bacterium]
MAHHVPADRFEALVADALDEVPDEFWPALENLVVVIEDRPPPGEDLLGLYEGVPITERSPLEPPVLPDRISIYRIPHGEEAEDAEDLAALVRETVLHEVGHHLGLSEDRLEELGWA